MVGREMTREWRSSGDSRLLRAAWVLQMTQQAGEVGGGREANLYNSGSSGLMKVKGEWSSRGDCRVLRPAWCAPEDSGEQRIKYS